MREKLETLPLAQLRELAKSQGIRNVSSLRKSELIDFVILQQDAFDPIDAVTPLVRQEFMLDKVIAICRADFQFETFLEVMDYFKKVINIFKQMNYSEYESEPFKKFNEELDALLKERMK